VWEKEKHPTQEKDEKKAKRGETKRGERPPVKTEKAGKSKRTEGKISLIHYSTQDFNTA